jgi:lipid-binding SYLF domain-containing protein
MDYIIVLHDYKAVKTFCSRMHFSLGAGCSAAAGPVGRCWKQIFMLGIEDLACAILTAVAKVFLR